MSIPVSGLKVFDSSSLTITGRLSDAQWRDMKAMEAGQYVRVRQPEDTVYAQVVKDGKVLATLTNNGFAQSSNAIGAQLQGVFEGEGSLQGPELAQWRAERIAQLLGGNVIKASTAQTQAQWKVRTSPVWTVDFAGLVENNIAVPEELKSQTFGSQQLAQETVAALLALNEV